MLAHPQQHQQPVSQNSMSYNVQAHKNLSSSSTSTGAYSIQNMKEEPSAGANNYPNAVNGNGADDMAVSELGFDFIFFICRNLWFMVF